MLLAMKTRDQCLVRFDPFIVTVEQSSTVSQIVSSPVVLSQHFLKTQRSRTLLSDDSVGAISGRFPVAWEFYATK